MKTDIVEDVPCWATVYLMYGDDTGLSEEDKKECDEFVADLRKQGMVLIEPIEESHSGFNSWPAFGLACDTENWVAEVVPKRKSRAKTKDKA